MAKRGRRSKPETFTGACSKLLTVLEQDLRARLDDDAELRQGFEADYAEAKEAGRTGRTKTDWIGEQLTQIGASWILGSVFVRFAEDNALIERPLLSGSTEGVDGAPSPLARAQDAERAYYAEHPAHAEPEYLAQVFREVSGLPGMGDLFDERHALLWRLSPRVEGARALLELLRGTDDETGALRWGFAEPELDTRFLGDLYQDLSEAVRKHYALLQTPDFVEAFILDRALEPAVETFGLSGFRLIDPTCGSGHFLLGAFERLLAHWREAEPGTEVRELVARALDAVHGVDLNPFAVAIARFRLTVAALNASGFERLEDSPVFPIHIEIGDSLLHGPRFNEVRDAQTDLFGEEQVAFTYAYEDRARLYAILGQQYHCVVGNPPYITPKDKALNARYRERCGSCSGKYILSVPFLERFVDLAVEGGSTSPAGFTGQITSNAFMKREYGKKLIEQYFPNWDLTHVVDTSGAYIPGHNTPTVVLFIRNQRPSGETVRAVLGIRGEPSKPEAPALGQVWTEIVESIDKPGTEGTFVSIADVERATFSEHPWSIGGGGAAELKELIEARASSRLEESVESIGITCFTLEDDVFIRPPGAFERRGCRQVRSMLEGNLIRDWSVSTPDSCAFFYDDSFDYSAPKAGSDDDRAFWGWRSNLRNNKLFGSLRKAEGGIADYEFGRLTDAKLRTPLSIAYAEIATHNHFVLDRGGKVFKQTAPVIKLPPDATEDDHYALLAVLNSSLGCFWGKQVFFPKGGDSMGTDGARVRKTTWDFFFAWDATKLAKFPIRSVDPRRARDVELAAQGLQDSVASGSHEDVVGERQARLVGRQEELDWHLYRIFEIAPSGFETEDSELPDVRPGERAFEIVHARAVRDGVEEAIWFERHGIDPIAEIPERWPTEYRTLVQRRIDLIESDKQIGLLERPENKRRWSTLDLDGLRGVKSRSVALGRAETEVRELGQPCTAAVLAERCDGVDTQDLDSAVRAHLTDAQALEALVADDAIPFLERLRFKGPGLRTAEAWHETWRLQRLEDPFLDEQDQLLTDHFGPEPAEQRRARAHVACWKTSDKVTKEKDLDEAALGALATLRDEWLAIDARRQAAIGGETPPVPPKYKPTDFRSQVFWRLRGKLDVPKERFISYPHCSPGGDDSLLIGWAGWDHEQRAGALAQILEARKSEGWTGERLAPILLGIDELLFWLEKWHGDLADEYRGYLDQEVAAAGLTLEQVRAWEPPTKTRRRKRTKRASKASEE